MSVQVLYDQLIELRLPTFLEALREQQATVWDFTAQSRVQSYFPKLKDQMLPDEL